MSATISLPSVLRVRLSAVRRRLRLLRIVSGFALLVVVLGFLAAAAVLADCWLDLSASTRQILVWTWLAVALAWLVRGAIVPLCRRIEAAALAAVIEEKYPDLGERLSSAVELAGASAEGHGSPLLIALLLEETAARSEPLDFCSAVSARRAAVRSALAAVTLLLIAAPVLLWPQQYAKWAQRFFRPWDIALAEAPADIAVTQPGEAITPVELAADSPTITITPPAYARSVKKEETFRGLVDLAALQYSEIRFDCRFTRPAVAAYLEWSEASGGRKPPVATKQGAYAPRSLLTLNPGRQAASLTISAIVESKYRLILEAERDTRTELPGGTIHVQLDQPPSVRRFTGKTETRSVLPYERIPFEIEAVDDIGVAGIDMEYRVNDGEIVRQPLELQGGNTPSAAARHVLELAGKVQQDDSFSYRFRVSDNLPKEYKGPHVLYYPPDRWLTLQIARRGDTLLQQEILAERDEINRRLHALREALQREIRGVEQAKRQTHDQKSLPPEQLESIKQLQQENQANQNVLQETAQLAEAAPALQPVAELARDMADQEMHKSQQALEQAPRQASPAERSSQLKTANEQLGSAVKRLEELQKTNERLAQDRLHQAKLEMLAQREKQLAEQAARLAAKHPVIDPKAREWTEKLQREQAETTGELERLAQESEPLKQSLQQARQEEAQKLAQRARELAKAQRDLTRAQAENKPKHAAAQQQEQQRHLQEETGELHRQFQRLTQETREPRPMQSALQRATGHTQQAQEAMQQARSQGQRGEATAEKQSQERAAQQLDQAAQAAAEAARVRAERGNEGKPKSGSLQAGEALAQAGRQMTDAQGQLNRGQAAQAQAAMQQAARALAQSAQHLAAPPAQAAQQPGMPGQQTGLGRQAGGLPDLSAYGLDKAAYAGKSWGDLPGELRTKIVQDMKARYGDDYARMIKSYFEQIADTKKKFSREP
jgi:hypothetical protein